ncbi:hypothetical protein SAMN05192583_2183 [Sphingomonas gellani]|uniref:DUF2218 domain-containing protein n=1 Tax=Sphingomonas gellani TaxID=1166340 RepID=A0A1H8EHH1_9SPHN|nr:DUF2218 domain-containing protein [Sphingomonas gellani]SEN18922.1 hypothetical protein SAMN05192583_2183 [Sphingomonas gellani]
MTTIHAHVPTQSASRYLQQLAKHWSHKMPVTFDAEHADFAFPNGTRLVLDAEADRLRCSLEVPEGEDAERMVGVLTSHLDRFAFREAPLAFVRD